MRFDVIGRERLDGTLQVVVGRDKCLDGLRRAGIVAFYLEGGGFVGFGQRQGDALNGVFDLIGLAADFDAVDEQGGIICLLFLYVGVGTRAVEADEGFKLGVVVYRNA